MSCNFGLQAVRRRAQTYVHIHLMANRTHSSSGHSQRFEWNLLATSEHRYGELKRLGHQKSEPSGLSNKRNSNFATCLAAIPVVIGFLCLLVVTPVRPSLSLCLLWSKSSLQGMPLIQHMQPCKCNVVRYMTALRYVTRKPLTCANL